METLADVVGANAEEEEERKVLLQVRHVPYIESNLHKGWTDCNGHPVSRYYDVQVQVNPLMHVRSYRSITKVL